jgi:hypothetical protein
LQGGGKSLHVILFCNHGVVLIISNDGEIDSGRLIMQYRINIRDPLFVGGNIAHRKTDQPCVPFVKFRLLEGESFNLSCTDRGEVAWMGEEYGPSSFDIGVEVDVIFWQAMGIEVICSTFGFEIRSIVALGFKWMLETE